MLVFRYHRLLYAGLVGVSQYGLEASLHSDSVGGKRLYKIV